RTILRPLRHLSDLCDRNSLPPSPEPVERQTGSMLWDRFNYNACFALRFALSLSILGAAAAGQQALQLDPAQSTLKFTLGASLHTVHGSFQLKHGALRFDASTGKLSGDIIADAKSGETANDSRDRKMHREILESERYPEIVFRPDRIEGPVAERGKSSVKIHGAFSLHGTDHEMVLPAEVEMTKDHWAAN